MILQTDTLHYKITIFPAAVTKITLRFLCSTRNITFHRLNIPWPSSLSAQQTERLERVQNEAMCIIFGCATDTPRMVKRFLFDFPTKRYNIKIWREHAYLKISADEEHSTYSELLEEKKGR